MDNVKVSILITTFKRPHLLKWGLHSLARQKCKYKFEVIVLNDGIPDETEAICKMYEPMLDIKYVFTGHRNINDTNTNVWRVPGFAFNIGAKIATGNVLFLSCAEMWHVNDSVEIMTTDLLNSPGSRVVCYGLDDISGGFLKAVNEKHGHINSIDLDRNCEKLNYHLPFFMGMMKSSYFNIGGYDEDFVGIAWEDNDFIYRLEDNGIRQITSKCTVVHLWHQRLAPNAEFERQSKINRDMFYQRRGRVLRNQGREWGKAPDPLTEEQINKFKSQKQLGMNGEWHLAKIPKIVHFYWGNEKISFLRYLSVLTFRKFNPEWRIMIHLPTVTGSIVPTWRSGEQRAEKVFSDYFEQLKQIPGIEFVEHNFSLYSFPSDAHEVHKSDFLRWILLSTYGGVWSDCDIVYTTSINKLPENTKDNADKNVFLCKYNASTHHAIGFLMAEAGSLFFQHISNIARRSFKSFSYQSMGSIIFNQYFQTESDVRNVNSDFKPVFLNSNCVYSIDSDHISAFYKENRPCPDAPGIIGFHWYAGHPMAQEYDNAVTEYNYTHINKTISNIIKKALDAKV